MTVSGQLGGTDLSKRESDARLSLTHIAVDIGTPRRDVGCPPKLLYYRNEANVSN